MSLPSLFPYQVEGSTFLAGRRHAALYDDMRLGKTRQVLSAARRLTVTTGIVVCKASGQYVWESESAQWGFNPVVLTAKERPQRNRLNIVSYNMMIRDDMFERLMALRSVSLVVADESHFLKNDEAQRTQRFFGEDCKMKNCIASLGANVWVTTGTPMLNHAAELYPTLRALFPSRIKMKRTGIPATYGQFVARYCHTVGNEWDYKIVGSKNLPELRQRMKGCLLRRTKKQVWTETPDMIIADLPIKAHMPKLPTEELQLVLTALAFNGDTVEALEDVAEYVQTLRRMMGLAKVKGVVEWVNDNISELGKVILFAHHKELIVQLREAFPNHACIIGGMSAKAKRDEYTRFLEDDDCRVFIGQNAAAGDSIPLYSASTTLMIEPDWSPKQNAQCLGRMEFHDKREPCTGYFVSIPDSLDDRITSVYRRKAKEIEEMGL